MKRVLLASFTLAALAAGARAENLRYPETGDPAFVITTPDGWTHTVNANGNLIVFNEPHTASINFKIGELDGSLDELAAKAASTPDGMPPANRGTADIAGGYKGTVYESKFVTPGGVKTDLRMILVRLDEGDFFESGHFAAAVLLTAEGINDDQRDAARAVLANARLTAPPAPPPAAPAATPAPAPDAAPTSLPAPKP
ncbi:MAG: hypothetical protein ISS15_17055 [Alphaproteobacteria bacterium]|nr:hypothetical protein [Alphaproteobacteria bacterium]MBL7099370.1 hypothetical protein [Alphaproteobacteria bacterium]